MTARNPNKPPRRTKRTVYIGLRQWDPGISEAVNCNGLNIRAFDFTPQEVHDIIVAALSAAAAEHQLKEKDRAALNS